MDSMTRVAWKMRACLAKSKSFCDYSTVCRDFWASGPLDHSKPERKQTERIKDKIITDTKLHSSIQSRHVLHVSNLIKLVKGSVCDRTFS